MIHTISNRPESWLQGARTSQMPEWIASNPKAFRLLYEFAERSRRISDDIEYEDILIHLNIREFITGRESTSKKIGISEQEYRTLYKKFERLQYIETVKITNKFTIGRYLADSIFFNNSSVKQPDKKPAEKPSDNPHPTTINKVNNENKDILLSSPNGDVKRKDISFKEEDYQAIINEYQSLKDTTFQGKEFLPLKQTIKTMFLSGRTPSQIIEVMRYISQQNYTDWTIRTVQTKLPEVLPKIGFVQKIEVHSTYDNALIEQALNEGGRR